MAAKPVAKKPVAKKPVAKSSPWYLQKNPKPPIDPAKLWNDFNPKDVEKAFYQGEFVTYGQPINLDSLKVPGAIYYAPDKPPVIITPQMAARAQAGQNPLNAAETALLKLETKSTTFVTPTARPIKGTTLQQQNPGIGTYGSGATASNVGQVPGGPMVTGPIGAQGTQGAVGAQGTNAPTFAKGVTCGERKSPLNVSTGSFLFLKGPSIGLNACQTKALIGGFCVMAGSTIMVTGVILLAVGISKGSIPRAALKRTPAAKVVKAAPTTGYQPRSASPLAGPDYADLPRPPKGYRGRTEPPDAPKRSKAA